MVIRWFVSLFAGGEFSYGATEPGDILGVRSIQQEFVRNDEGLIIDHFCGGDV